MSREPAAVKHAAGSRVLAVVVSYFAGAKLTATVYALAGQVGKVLVVDNGSDDQTLATLRQLEADGQIALEALGENRGLGYALNLGARRAEELGYEWLLTMDQDSIADPAMVTSLLALAEHNPSVRCISPNIALHGRPPQSLKAGPVDYAITSGNLIRLDVWKGAGPFNEDYFIDCVDFDFSLRARREGYAIHKAPAALLYHELGQELEVRRPFDRFYTQHSPLRRYYMFRNFMYLARAHVLLEPRFIGKLLLMHVLLLALMLVYEPMLKQNIRFICRGLVDFFLGRKGAYIGAPN
jgi:rhamnosyltransferase